MKQHRKRVFAGIQSNTFTYEQVGEVGQMYKRGSTLAQIAEHFGCSDAPVKNALVMCGSPKRIGAGRARARTVAMVNPYTGDIRLNTGEFIPAFKGRWKVGDVWRNE